MIEVFPYPVQVFSKDGTVIIANKAAFDVIGIKSPESHIGKYNVFRDPVVKALGAGEKVREVLRGRTVYLNDFNAPYKDLVRYFNVRDRDIQTISTDITCFPVMESDGEVEYFAAMFFIKKIYRGKRRDRMGKAVHRIPLSGTVRRRCRRKGGMPQQDAFYETFQETHRHDAV